MPPPPSSKQALDGEALLAELGWVRALARSLVRDAALAEDAAHETCLLALERPPRAASGSALRAWLARVTRTAVRVRLRAERARERREAAHARPEASEPSAGEVVARAELLQRLVATVMELDEPYRSAVLLRHVEELSAREIAARQGTSVENARQRVARGLAELRRRLDREHGGDGRAWALALLPLLRASPRGLLGPLLGGSLVKTTCTLIVSLAALLLGVVLLRTDDGRASSPRAASSDAAGSSLLPAAAPAWLAAPAETSGARREALEAAGARPGPARASLLARARLLDARGLPLAGATLALQARPSEGARADEQGAVELALDDPLPLLDDPQGALLAFVARAPGCRDTLRLERAPQRAPDAGAAGAGEPEPSARPLPAVLELGELRLVPVGALGGFVRDASGASVAGAEVRLTLPTLGLAEDESVRLFGPPYVPGERRATTDAQGRFLFESVEAGLYRAWAGRSGHAWKHGESVRVEPKAAQEELLLVLAALEEDALVRGTVVDASGRALEGVDVFATPAGAEQPTSYVRSDADGRFVLGVRPGRAHRVGAQLPSERGGEPDLGPACAEGVVGGGAELTLVLRAARWLELEVVDARDGAALSGWVTELREGALPESWRCAPGTGVARVLLPAQAFSLRVGAEGYANAELGPFDAALPAQGLRIALHALPRLRGVVRTQGRPVAHALVQLVRPAPQGELVYLYGFPTRLDGTGLVGTFSDADGRYELPLAGPGTRVLVCQAAGLPAYESEPFEVGALGSRDRERDVELGLAGAIEGRVLVAPGESAAGVLVRVSNGDMRVHEAVSDERGDYRIEALAPGRYMLLAQRQREGESRGRVASAIERVRVEDFPFPWALEVRAGESTQHDVDLDELALADLSGRLLVDGLPQPLASVRLVPCTRAWTTRSWDQDERTLDAEGRFRFEGRRAEPHWLVLELAEGPLSGTTLVRRVELARGAGEIELALESAGARGALPEGASAAPCALLSELGPEAFAFAPVQPAGGRFACPSVVACAKARLVQRGEGDAAADPSTWHALASLALPAGRVSELE